MTSLIAAIAAIGCQSSPLEPTAEVTDVEILPAELTTESGRLARFTATPRDANGQVVPNAGVDWSTDDPSIAIVDSDGYVWSFKEGTVTATAASPGVGGGASNGNAYGRAKKTATVQVTDATTDRPERVSDLAVDNTTTSSATLSFTEVGNGLGEAADYVVRFQIAPIEWGSAANVIQGRCKSPLQGTSIGTHRTCEVEGLAPGYSYEFQVIAFRGTLSADAVYGDLSNVAAGTTKALEPTLAGAEGYPNQPAGMTAIGLLDFTSEWVPQTGEVYYTSSSNKTFMHGVETPSGDGSVIRLRFPEGEQDGTSYGRRFDLWGPQLQEDGGVEYSELYVSYWILIEGDDFENQRVGTKTFYVAYGSTKRSNHSTMFLNGPGADGQAVMDSVVPSYYIYEMQDDGSDAGGGSIKHNPNQTWKRIVPGSWHHVEAYFKINDIGPTTDNGEFKMWINGTQTHHYTGIRWRSDENPHRFYHLQFTPVYGGNAGEVRTRDDFWRIDNLYISARE